MKTDSVSTSKYFQMFKLSIKKLNAEKMPVTIETNIEINNEMFRGDVSIITILDL